MSFHHIDFTPTAKHFYSDSKLLPQTLPVMYESESVALAVFDKNRYSFMLPDSIGAKIAFSDLEPVFIFGQTGKGWSRVPGEHDELLYIVLEPKSRQDVNARLSPSRADAADNPMQPGSNAI